MEARSEEIFLAAVLTMLLMVMLVTIIIIAIVKYQNRYRKHLKEISDIRTAYQNELLKAELEVKEQAFNTISQEIHDNIGQVLSLAKLNLNKVLQGELSHSADSINVTKDLIGKAIQDLRNISRSMNREYISNLGLPEILRADMELLERSGVYDVKLTVEGPEKNIDKEKKLICYRIIQESVSNIIKHAKATVINVEIVYTATQVSILIRDNGIGFIVGTTPLTGSDGGSGMYNMQNRARLIGADFLIESNLNQGTSLTLRLPLNQHA